MDNGIFEIGVDVEDIQTRMSCGVNALIAIHTAMESGLLEPSEFLDGFYGVCDYLDGLNAKLCNIGERCIEITERQRGAAVI